MNSNFGQVFTYNPKKRATKKENMEYHKELDKYIVAVANEIDANKRYYFEEKFYVYDEDR